ncbi:guanine nucleotide binding protein, alpha subunit [Tricholoma matsutake]|nr:guanine nucleotide binding protein, alpha subunit [Tricholoma matsutake 945]
MSSDIAAQNEFELIAGGYDDERAKRVSNQIDDEIRKDSARRRDARNREVKVMLLGQAESGKSTLQKQFQLYYASTTLDYERPSWRPVVYFNVIKAIRMILDELDYEFSRARAKESLPAVMEEDGVANPAEEAKPWSIEVENTISQLRVELLPLVAIEDTLASELSGGVSVTGGRTGAYVRSGWQALVTPSWAISDNRPTVRQASEVINLAGRTLSATVNALKSLWEHHSVKHIVDIRQLKLDESAAFFLNNIHRIAQPDYVPTNDDILSVRLQTLGVMEHTFPINMGGSTYDWKLYDVGGARHAWVPYFDDAPISAFDQYLEEDPRTNRIDDSLQLFTAICSNKLLKDAHLVLLLNKTDILKKKLDAGMKLRKYITSYGDRPNTYGSVSEYFKTHFVQVHRRSDVSRRSLYVDIKATQRIIANVGEVIIRQHIAQIGLA